MRIVIESASSFDSLQARFNVPNATCVVACNQQTFGAMANPLVLPAGCNVEFCGGLFIGRADDFTIRIDADSSRAQNMQLNYFFSHMS